MIGQTEIMHNSLGPEKLLATWLKDKVDQPISVCLRLPRAQGKTDWAINEKLSQVLWLEGGISLCVCADDYTTIDTLFLLFVDISTAFFQYRGGIYTGKVSCSIYFGGELLLWSLYIDGYFSNAVLDYKQAQRHLI